MAALEQDPLGLRETVLVVDDDDSVRRLVCERLESEGFEALEASDGQSALAAIARLDPDLVILDLRLPALSGFEVLRRLQQADSPPVILLSGLDSESDRILGLEMGADDYVTKPFSGRELAVRARNIIKRSLDESSPGPGTVHESTIDGVLLSIDVSRRRVELGGEEVVLTPREFSLLHCMVQHPGQVLTKPQLLGLVWDAEVGWVGEATVTEHVRRLRSKLRVEGSDASCIETLWGVGYRFKPSA